MGMVHDHLGMDEPVPYNGYEIVLKPSGLFDVRVWDRKQSRYIVRSTGWASEWAAKNAIDNLRKTRVRIGLPAVG